jgi:hypothetical protein
MKKYFQFFIAVVLCLVAVAMTACGDDDEPKYKVKGDAIDLGLSVNWASQNVGAVNTTGYGTLYGWADSLGINTTLEGIKVSFKLEGGVEKTYCEWNSAHYGGMNPPLNIAGSQFDFAHYQWGGIWRMPTRDEWQELIERCSWTEVTQEGVKGMKVTGPSGNSIFLPYSGMRDAGSITDRDAIGNYWTDASVNAADQSAHNFVSNVRCCAWSVVMQNGKATIVPQLRCNGLSLRPVMPK